MTKIRNITFATTVALLLLTGFPRRASAAVDIFLTLGQTSGESSAAHAIVPVSMIVSTVWSALAIL
jgi:hypothetical protein